MLAVEKDNLQKVFQKPLCCPRVLLCQAAVGLSDKWHEVAGKRLDSNRRLGGRITSEIEPEIGSIGLPSILVF